jgi:hypothetical protein
MTRTILAVAAIIVATVAAVQAHPGRTNAAGCHNDRISGGYHCH